MAEHGFVVDAIADVRIDHQQIQDWLPTLFLHRICGFKMSVHSLRVPVPTSEAAVLPGLANSASTLRAS